jgi:uncharacterized phage-associated protein
VELFMARATAVANYFIDKAAEKGRPLTPLEVIKLVYIAHGWHLAVYGGPLVDEPAQAWRYGPVFPSLYRSLKRYGGQPITSYAVDFTPGEQWPDAPYIPADTDTRELLDKVWEEYSKYSGPQLVDITHSRNSPWSQVAQKHGTEPGQGAIINNDLIKSHFERKAQARRSSRPETG